MEMERIGNVRPVAIEDEMRTSYIDYAMSVIVARALPDVRDGLKPVHRRILYTMHEMGLRPNTAFRKSAAGMSNRLLTAGAVRCSSSAPRSFVMTAR